MMSQSQTAEMHSPSSIWVGGRHHHDSASLIMMSWDEIGIFLVVGFMPPAGGGFNLCRQSLQNQTSQPSLAPVSANIQGITNH